MNTNYSLEQEYAFPSFDAPITSVIALKYYFIISSLSLIFIFFVLIARSIFINLL
jgi:hypothetical protein